ncbi:DUF6671 family protein [Pseudoalteromonas sp. A25]|uniref:DUF6671 family protein n=1 Tax=Pseudoalteromonas sp. A25 TaxID=116092 RepID=UPI0012610805|nr:DUF6671 family protein [Pseudoalteromonas sp. A25]
MKQAHTHIDWSTSTIALLTKHHKQPMIEPALSQLGVRLFTTDQFDTDTLGTFSKEIPRTLNALECAKKKAYLAAKMTGERFGLGSEGSFGGGPYPGIVQWDDEILVLHDSDANEDIVSIASGPVPLRSVEFKHIDQLSETLWQTPTQGWMLNINNAWFKGITTQQQLKTILKQHHWESGQPLTLQPDLRAMHCPPRQHMIKKAAEQLANRMQSRCPQCNTPDFWVSKTRSGLPCKTCQLPTQVARCAIKQCKFCDFTLEQPNEHKYANPSHCQFCNP